MQQLPGITPNVIDLDIRDDAWRAIAESTYRASVGLDLGDSTEKSTFEKVTKPITNQDKLGHILDSNHTHEHVLIELKM
jgi:cephalosporin hydroxylase